MVLHFYFFYFIDLCATNSKCFFNKLINSNKFSILSINRVRWEDSITVHGSSKISSNSTEAPSVGQSDAVIINERNEYLMTYTCIMVVGIVGCIIRSFAFFRLCLQISINMHNMIFCGITRAKMAFFNNNPSGRIVNRFARDISNIDTLLPNVMIDVMTVSSKKSFIYSIQLFMQFLMYFNHFSAF